MDSIKQKKVAINRYLESLLSKQNTRLTEAMNNAVLSGGKRYRPLLLLASADCFGVEQAEAMPFACALELIHNYSLIHDDLPCMDDDDKRRGQPTCHKTYGEDIALLTGDALLTLAFEVSAGIATDDKAAYKKLMIVKNFSHLAGTHGMIGGQYLDITLSPELLTEKELYELMEKKTGGLILAAVQAGAILGEVSSVVLKAVSEFGRNIGLAFQIRDDIQDSEEDSIKEDLARPNSVSVLGFEEAKKRLQTHVQTGIKILDNANIKSEEMCYLARILLS